MENPPPNPDKPALKQDTVAPLEPEPPMPDSCAGTTAESTNTPDSESKNEQPSRGELLIYGGATAGQDFAGGVGSLAMPILNIGLGLNPGLIGSVLALTRLWDAITDPVMAQISDNHRGRHGRRRPFILLGGIAAGITTMLLWAFPASWSELSILIWFTCFYVIYMTFQTVFLVPYYALGIELSPDYNGRTRVVAYRSLMNKATGMVVPWFFPFCLLPIFSSSLQGVRVLSVTCGIIFAVSAILAFRFTRERTIISALPPAKRLSGMWPAVKQTLANPNFLRIIGIYLSLTVILQVFVQLHLYVTIYHVFQGDKSAGATVGAIATTVGTFMAFLAIPLTTWACGRFQKHNALSIALGLMILGNVAKWFLYTPDYPYLLIIIQFFYAPGISGVFIILASMMADLVDEDELRTGDRREGMFGAAASWIIKGSSAIAAGISGWVLVVVGFDAILGAEQSAQTIFWLRILFSVVPAALCCLVLLFLYKYPLTRKRVEEIQLELKIAREERTKSPLNNLTRGH